MSSVSDIKNSKFLTKEDVGAGVLVTISKIVKENVAKEGAEEELRFCMYFNELKKPLVLNSTNAQRIADITGSEDEIEKTWPGHRIVLYNDENVSFGGKLTGGIRIRAPKNQKPAVANTVKASDDLPF